jgi:hypothetical protein
MDVSLYQEDDSSLQGKTDFEITQDLFTIMIIVLITQKSPQSNPAGQLLIDLLSTLPEPMEGYLSRVSVVK